MEPQVNMNMTEGQSRSQGPVIGIIIVVIVLLVGAFYFLGRFATTDTPDTTMTDDTAVQDDSMPPLSDSNEVSDIEADLNAEDFNNIDADLQSL